MQRASEAGRGRGAVRWISAWLLLAAAQPALAHDLWFVSQTCAPGVAPVELQLGTAGAPEERRDLEPARVARFAFSDGAVTTELPPAGGALAFPATGGVLFLDRTPALAELPPDTFQHYLVEEGHEAALAHRRATGAEGEGARESYTRHLKLLLGPKDRAFGAVTGQEHEIALLDDPLDRTVGRPFRVRLLHLGEPLADARIDVIGQIPAYGALSGAEPPIVYSARTGRDGTARLRVPAPGPLLLRSVHLEPCATCADSDWRSWWAAFTVCR